MLTWCLLQLLGTFSRVCLNPYSNGMLTWKFTLTADSNGKLVVLILILMECSLGRSEDEILAHVEEFVLILILMECSLGLNLILW